MEICQHCQMYMKPFVHETSANCEFCGEAIAIKKEGKWEKIKPESLADKETEA